VYPYSPSERLYPVLGRPLPLLYTVYTHTYPCAYADIRARVCALSVGSFIVHKHVLHSHRAWCVIVFDFSKSFMLSTFGFTCVAFVTGALAWWGPKFIHQGLQLQQGSEKITQEEWVWRQSVIHVVWLCLQCVQSTFLRLLNCPHDVTVGLLTLRNRASYTKDGHTATLQTPHFIYFFQQIYVLNFVNMLHTLRFYIFKVLSISYCYHFWFLYCSHFTYRVC
jgi:hypothetical protein